MEEVRHLETARQAPAVDLVGLAAGDRFAVQRNLARAHRMQRADEMEEHRLAGAIGADQRMALAALDAQVHAAQDLGGTEALAHAGELEGGGAHRVPPSASAAPTSAQRGATWRHIARQAAKATTHSASAPIHVPVDAVS